MKKVSHVDIQDVKEKLEDVERNYLRYRGWEHTCADTGGLWLWQKKLADGRTVLMNRSGALMFDEYNPDK